MIQLGTDSFESQNIYTAAKVFELTLALPATPAEHNVKIRIELTGLAADQDRRLHVLVTNEAQDHWLGNFYCDLYNAAADQYAHVFLGSFVVDASEGLSVLIESDNSGDTSVDAEAILFSDDLEYYVTWRAAEGSPLEHSLVERIKTVDDSRLTAANVWEYVLHNITNTQHAGHYLRTIDAVTSGTTNTDTTNEIAFRERQSNTEIARVTYGTVDGSRNSLTLS